MTEEFEALQDLVLDDVVTGYVENRTFLDTVVIAGPAHIENCTFKRGLTFMPGTGTITMVGNTIHG